MKIIEYSNGNRIIKGDRNSLASNIRFNGQGNILYLEDDVRMDESSCLTFNGNNGLAYFGSNIHPYKISLFLHNDTVFHIGRHNYINQNMECFLSEQRHIFIGREGIFSYGIKIVNSDAHVIYSIEDKKRINQSKSVFLGDHVWLGSEVRILKGSQMHSGSIIGQNSVVSGKNIKSNEIWGAIRQK